MILQFGLRINSSRVSSARVGTFILCGPGAGNQVGVDLVVLMLRPQQFLDATQVAAGFEQVVAKEWRKGADACGSQSLGRASCATAAAPGAPRRRPRVRRTRSFIGLGQRGALGQPRPQALMPGGRSIDALLAALAEHAHRAVARSRSDRLSAISSASRKPLE